MNKLVELRAVRTQIMKDRGLTTSEAVEWIAGELTKSPLTVWGWFNKSQLTPVPDNILKLIKLENKIGR
jgi:hypothetical protein